VTWEYSQLRTSRVDAFFDEKKMDPFSICHLPFPILVIGENPVRVSPADCLSPGSAMQGFCFFDA
jgi:hypothetical protein